MEKEKEKEKENRTLKRVLSLDRLLPNASENTRKKTDDFIIESLWNDITDINLKKSLIKLGLVIQKHKSSQIENITEWLGIWADYFTQEDEFEAKRFYKRGEIIHAHFGFKVGNELGGTHHALVIENDNAKANGTVIVVPLSSLSKEQTEGKSTDDIKDSLDNSEVYIGQGIINELHTYAKVGQICALSKLRIIWPKYPTQEPPKVDPAVLNEIDKKIEELCLNPKTTLAGKPEKDTTKEEVTT